MEIFNKLGKKASEAYKVTADKTGKLAKEAKLRMKIADLKSQISDIYKEIGKKVYENHVREEKVDLEKELEEECTKIDVMSAEIESNLKQCLELKDKRKCEKCFAEIDKDVKFCPECGAKQEEVEETEATKALLDTYKEFTTMVDAANAITDDLDARYKAYAKAEAYMLEHALVFPCYYQIGWCLSKVDNDTKMQPMFGSVGDKMKNWGSNVNGYTSEEKGVAEQIAAFSSEQ